ncbi:MAG: DNA translocase FtsK [Bacteroidales bacterium]|jgi:S-DNA-T family DNA segregation ATPase FtsK/SpoIIIE|nr:DNA translocase FtsK [Bacteroidales bacterium]
MYVARKKSSREKILVHRKSEPKSKTSVARKKSSRGVAFFRFFGDARVIKLYGILFMLFSIVLAVSIISFLFTHDADMSYLINAGDKGARPENVAGVVGATVARGFMDYTFGVFSIGFSLLFFLFGLKITFNKTPLALVKCTITTFLTMAWLSLCFGYIVRNSDYHYIYGAFGEDIAEKLYSLDSRFVAILILLFSFVAVAVLCYELPVQRLMHVKLPKFKPLSFSRIKRYNDGRNNDLKHTVSDIRMDTEMGDVYISKRTNELKDEFEGNVIHFDKEVKTEEKGNKTEKEVPFEIINSPFSDVEDDAENIETIDIAEKYPGQANPSVEFSGDEDMGEDFDSDTDQQLEVALKTPPPVPLEPYDPRKDLEYYHFPDISLLKEYPVKETDALLMRAELIENKEKIETTLKHFGILIKSITATVGPTVTLYEIVPADGIRISKIKNLEDDIALSLAALGIRIIAPIPGKGTIGIEVPNKNPKIVSMREIIEADRFVNNKFDLPIGLGKTISNESFVVDLAKMPHLLMAGATGQGKSVGLNAIIASLLYKKHPAELKFVMIDPKKVEFSLYSIIEKHYLAKLPDVEEPIITDFKKVVRTLKSLCKEMDDRYVLLQKAKVRNLKEYNAKFCNRQLLPTNGHRYLPYIVLIIDEFGDLIMTAGKEVEMPIARLAQLARAIGIHLIIATQRPSVNIITGIIKANFPARVAFRVSSKIDSRTILDGSGADQLIGKGDMLISTGSDLIRLQCAFVDTPEVEQIVKHIEGQQSYPDAFLLPEVLEDENGKGLDDDGLSPEDMDDMLVEAARLIVNTQQGSTSLIQRKLSLGYNRAGRIMDQLEDLGIVGPGAGSKPREVRIKALESLDEMLQNRGLI